MNITLDNEFSKINSLKWFPWVGDYYLENNENKRVLFIGESHYYKPDEKGSFKKHLDKGYTRTVIEKVAIGKEYKHYEKRTARIFPNIHFTFLGNDDIDSDTFWNKVAYYNFIQEPMKDTLRPSRKNFIDGWQTFQKIINLIKPDTCIFLGNSSAKYFPKTFNNGPNIVVKPTDDGWINNSAAKKAQLQLTDGHEIKLLFIRHPSNYFSWTEWNKHLSKRIPELMNWLKLK